MTSWRIKGVDLLLISVFCWKRNFKKELLKEFLKKKFQKKLEVSGLFRDVVG